MQICNTEEVEGTSNVVHTRTHGGPSLARVFCQNQCQCVQENSGHVPGSDWGEDLL